MERVREEKEGGKEEGGGRGKRGGGEREKEGKEEIANFGHVLVNHIQNIIGLHTAM